MAPRAAYSIDDALLERARERATDREGFRSADGANIVGSVLRNAAAAGLDPRTYVESIVDTSDVSSPPSGALLWSGVSPSDPNLSNRFVAEAWAERQSTTDPAHPVTTIEDTVGGSQLDNLRLFDLSNDQLDVLGLKRSDVRDMWSRLSERYTQQTTGQVRTFATDAFPAAVLHRTELPELRVTPEVGADRVEFAYEPPERLSTGEVVPDNVARPRADVTRQSGSPVA